MSESACSRSADLQRQSNRIARNTAVLFLRMFVLTIVNLYIVRLVLKGLGDDDYGTFNAVAGVVTALTCVSSVLAIATQRFYSYAAGKGNSSRLRDIFAVSVNINVLLSIVALIFFETIGLWYVSQHMPIPTDRLQSAVLIFHFSCISFVCTLLQIPFTAAIIANEDMGYYAIISTCECLLRLLVAYGIALTPIDHLVFYGAGLMVVSLIIMAAYAFVGRRYAECHYLKVTERSLYCKLLSFSGWTFFGSIAGVAMFQGNTLLLYEYFGPLATAAFAISIQINHAFNSLCSSTVLAFRPAMIRSYAAEKYDDVTKMFYIGNKFLLYILLVIAIPLMLEMDTIIPIWLDEHTAETILFARLMIIMVVIMSMHSPITIIMHAAGKVKIYHSISESIMLLCLPLSWLLFAIQLPAYACFISMIILCLTAHIARLLCLKRYYPEFSFLTYVTSLILPALIITTICVLLAYSCHIAISNPLLRFLIISGISAVTLFTSVYAIGLKSEERVIIRKMVSSILNIKP